MQIPVDSIKVKKRIRKNPDEIESLAESLKNFGQLNPVIISRDNVLVAGERRLLAAKYLGWHTIEAMTVERDDDLSLLEMEVEENLRRRDFTPEEIAEASRKIYRLKNPPWWLRIWPAIKRFFRKLRD